MLELRLQSQLLSGSQPDDLVAVAERLLAIQAQDDRGVRLAVRARSRGPVASDFDRALSEDRSLIVSWLNRGTLHMVRSEDYHWLHALSAPGQRAGNERRLRQEGVTAGEAERGKELIYRTLAEEGPATRERIRDVLDAAGVRTERQALIHILFSATLDGRIIRGPVRDGRQAFVLVEDWLGQQDDVDRDRSLAELARRFLAGHGPADDRDLAKWAALPLRDVRRGLEEIAPKLEERDDGLLDLKGRSSAPPLPAPRLLGAFDPLLHGWVSREPVLGDHKDVVTTNGIFRPIMLAAGRAVGIWRLAAGELTMQPFSGLSKATRQALDADSEAVMSFLTG